jgi:hypothetical protein
MKGENMEPLDIRVHSFCDVITNSSTSIFVMPTNKSISMIENLIDYFLKKAGSTKRASDVFNFKIELDENSLDNEFERYAESHPISKEIDDKINKLINSKRWSDARKIRVDFMREKIENNEWKVEAPSDDEENPREDHLIVIPKNDSKDVRDITYLVRQIFEIFNRYE